MKELWTPTLEVASDSVGFLLEGRPAYTSLAAALQGFADATTSDYGDPREQPLGMLLANGIHKTSREGYALEYVLHSAIRSRSPVFVAPIREALDAANFDVSGNLQSILLITDRSSVALLDSLDADFAEDARIATFRPGRPPSFNKELLHTLLASGQRSDLPRSISDLWRADLFVGTQDGSRWVGVDVKSKVQDLKLRAGLGLAVTFATGKDPAGYGRIDGCWVVRLPTLGGAYSAWQQGIRQVHLAAGIVQDRGKFAKLIGPLDDRAVAWLIRQRDRALGDVIGELWEQAGVDDPQLRFYSAPHDVRTLTGPQVRTLDPLLQIVG